MKSPCSFYNAKMGDKVWSNKLGWGIVLQIFPETFRIAVEFIDNGKYGGKLIKSFQMKDGKDWTASLQPELYWNDEEDKEEIILI